MREITTKDTKDMKKALSKLTNEHRAQVFNYLKSTDHKLGLLVNFGHYPKIKSERIVL